MIYGNGIDIQEIRKIQKAQEKRESFAKRILTMNELAMFKKYKENRKYEFLAGRFSAKEAFSKAYGTVIGKKVGFQDIEILNDNKTGKPEIVKFPGDNKLQAKISISHSGEYVVTEVILEKLTWQTKMKKFLIK